MKQNMFLIKEKPHNVVEKPTHRAGNKMWENWMEKEMEIFPNFILEKKQKSTIFEFIINPKNGQPILEHDTFLKQGAGIVTTRAHVNYIVTEYGVANLFGKNIRQRVKAMAEIAHPDFREQIEKEYFEAISS